MRALVLAMALTLLTGCGLLPTRHAKAEAIATSCDTACYVPCRTDDISWTADPTSPAAWDALGEEAVQPLAQRVSDCDLNRRACHVCLLRLQDKGVLIGVPPLPARP